MPPLDIGRSKVDALSLLDARCVEILVVSSCRNPKPSLFRTEQRNLLVHETNVNVNKLLNLVFEGEGGIFQASDKLNM